MVQAPDYRNKNYDISDFDEHMSLKLGANGFLLFGFLFSPLVLGLVAWAISDKERAMLLALYGIHKNLYLSVATALPVVFFAVVMLFKGEKPGPFVRRTWAQGRRLVQVSAVLNCVVSFYIAFIAVRHVSLAQIMISGLSLLALLYALRSNRLYDYFLKFPEKPES